MVILRARRRDLNVGLGGGAPGIGLGRGSALRLRRRLIWGMVVVAVVDVVVFVGWCRRFVGR